VKSTTWRLEQSRLTVPFILNLSTNQKLVTHFTDPCRRSLCYPLHGRGGGTTILDIFQKEEKTFLCWESNPRPSSPQPSLYTQYAILAVIAVTSAPFTLWNTEPQVIGLTRAWSAAWTQCFFVLQWWDVSGWEVGYGRPSNCLHCEVCWHQCWHQSVRTTSACWNHGPYDRAQHRYGAWRWTWVSAVWWCLDC
jgi:hypothetical protein